MYPVAVSERTFRVDFFVVVVYVSVNIRKSNRLRAFLVRCNSQGASATSELAFNRFHPFWRMFVSRRFLRLSERVRLGFFSGIFSYYHYS